jgi:5-formyltetrahydrofolate cyclo-ligase
MTHPASTTAPDTTAFSIRPSDLDKVALRRHLLAQRRGIAAPLRAQWDALIAQQVLAWCQQFQVDKLGIYTPIRGEPDLSATFLQLHQAGVALCLPIVVAAQEPLQFARWQPSTVMRRDQFGIPIPAEPEWETLPPFLLIPCVGFNAAGYRLGYGGGFYDRTLAKATAPTISVGIAYQCLASEFTPGPHDIALNQIITEIIWPPCKP